MNKKRRKRKNTEEELDLSLEPLVGYVILDKQDMPEVRKRLLVDYVILDKQDMPEVRERLLTSSLMKENYIYEAVVRILSKKIIQIHSKESATEEDIDLFLEMVMNELKGKRSKLTLKEVGEVID
ncbi:MAG: hypothetical protein NZ526_08045, partial [Aquificaceae bacterium]|nr:hypothetical protein [Aquificaceae bacterium]